MFGSANYREHGPEDITDEVSGWRRQVPAISCVVFAAIFFALYLTGGRLANERDRALDLQRRSYEVIALARNVEGTVARAESLLARYVVSLDVNDGRRYADEWRQAVVQIENLRRVARYDPVQRILVRRLQDAYAERARVLNDVALRTNYDQKLGALGRLYEANRTRDADRIHRILEAAIRHEMGILAARSSLVAERQADIGQLSGGYGIAGALLLMAVVVALWLASTEASERRFVRRLAHSEARRVDSLEVAVGQRTEELEVANRKLRTEMEERAQAEESLRQLHKMEAIGQLTGGIAHDFNNMLAVIMGGLELARRRMRDDDEAAHHIDNAVEGTNRAASLTRQLLAFARAEPLLPGTIEPDALIHGMAELIDRTIGDRIAVVIEARSDDWRLWADRHQLENALINLCVNARDAMDGHGTLTVAASAATLRAGEIGDCAAGEYILLSVRDTGRGMTPEILERVFEPFFTTKPVGKGTGLGLSQVFGYVGQWGGHIRIRSKPGIGTEVEIALPRHVETHAAPPVPAAADPAKPLAAPRRTVLVVEDDPRVLATTLTALEELDHRGIACGTPLGAAAILAERPDIELVLTDVLMPEQTGPEMIAALRADGLSLPVIFVTGFAGDDAEAGLLDGEHVLRKPYTLAQLDRIVEAAIPSSGATVIDMTRMRMGSSGTDGAVAGPAGVAISA